MDLFWSGLVQRASEHTWYERKSQFSGVHERALQCIELEKKRESKQSATANQYNILSI